MKNFLLKTLRALDCPEVNFACLLLTVVLVDYTATRKINDLQARLAAVENRATPTGPDCPCNPPCPCGPECTCPHCRCVPSRN